MKPKSKAQREHEARLEIIRCNLHWACIHVDRKDYDLALHSTKSIIELLNKVDEYTHLEKSKQPE